MGGPISYKESFGKVVKIGDSCGIAQLALCNSPIYKKCFLICRKDLLVGICKLSCALLLNSTLYIRSIKIVVVCSLLL
jgi:hypothetical protein